MALVLVLAGGLPPCLTAQPSLQPLVQPGKWPVWPRGSHYDVKVVQNFAYVALGASGLGVFDVSNPANPIQVGGFATSGRNSSGGAIGLAMSGNYAFVVKGEDGLEIIDVSNPSRCVRVGIFRTSGGAFFQVAIAARQ